MSTEADDFDNTQVEKPFNPSKKSGEPQGNLDLEDALRGIPDQESDDFDEGDSKESVSDKSENAEKEIDDPNAKKLHDKYSARIQEKAEEMYAQELTRARKDADYLTQLVESTDPLDQKMAKKLLTRNPEFGADSIEKYRAKLKIEAAGDDPQARKLAEQEAEILDLKNRQNESDWKAWKRGRQIEEGTPFEKELDEIHREYSTMPFVDMLTLAKGRIGEPAKSQKETVGGFGDTAPAESDFNANSPLAKALLRGTDVKEIKKFAKQYLS